MSSTDGWRVFVSAWLVYVVFLNPRLQSSMTWNYIDAAVSFVQTGRWDLQYADLYFRIDTAAVGSRVVSGMPPGPSFLIVPIYAVWDRVVGPITSAEGFQALNALLAFSIGTVASALTAVQVQWFAEHLGADRVLSRRAALLFAFGTQAFFLGTTFYKENLAGLALITSLRWAVQAPSVPRAIGSGILAGAAGLTSYPTFVFALVVVAYVLARDGIRRSVLTTIGPLVAILVLLRYNRQLFGAAFHFSTFSIAGVNQSHPPNLTAARIMLQLMIGFNNGLLIYSPFVVVAFWGLWISRRGPRVREMLVTAAIVVALWLAAALHQSQFDAVAEETSGLGPRQVFPAIPLLAAFAALRLSAIPRRLLHVLAVVSIGCGYLGAQAGMTPGTVPFVYCVKTFISGTGMGVLFKEAIPIWFGFDTLHTMVSRPDVGAADLVRMLPTADGLRLMRNQGLLLVLNAVLVGAVVMVVVRLWRAAAEPAERASLT